MVKLQNLYQFSSQSVHIYNIETQIFYPYVQPVGKKRFGFHFEKRI
jgi:hypothetical protein